ncbi:hypothetical protein SAMN05443529_14120 [Desulfosporosinus hippei DSM 8344]|uniref:Uncharacterized protein n=1 Tax=Desulfosporosinus hippei DSM 8344 TaxID=1121419 RepID=A0A1G8KUW3_9FIRM|nr:hypothetical protein SAMN05443529_14120 [Desulfosporosinus hippei DSM 8344]
MYSSWEAPSFGLGQHPTPPCQVLLLGQRNKCGSAHRNGGSFFNVSKYDCESVVFCICNSSMKGIFAFSELSCSILSSSLLVKGVLRVLLLVGFLVPIPMGYVM